MCRSKEGKGYANLHRSEEEEGNGNMGSSKADPNKNISNKRHKSVDRKDSFESKEDKGFGSLRTDTKSQTEKIQCTKWHKQKVVEAVGKEDSEEDKSHQVKEERDLTADRKILTEKEVLSQIRLR